MATPSPHLWAYFDPGQPPPPFVAAPEDIAAKDRILLLARYAMQNGVSFIQTVQQKQAGNPEYAFMTPGGKDEPFYRWALYSTGCGLPIDQPLPQGFVPPVPQPQQYMPQPQQMYQHPQQQYMQQPYYPQQHMPQYQPYQGMPVQQVQQQQRPTPPPISPEVAGGFSQVLDALTGSKDSIKASQGWFMACAPYAAGMAYMMASRASTSQEFEKLLHLIYLANDILVRSFAAQQQQQADGQSAEAADGSAEKASIEYSALAAAFAPALGVMLSAAQAMASTTANAVGQEKLNKMLIFWQDKGLFPPSVTTQLQQDMGLANAATVLLANYPPTAQPQPQPQQPQQQQAAPSTGWGPPPAAAAAPAPGWGPVPSTAAAAPNSGGWGAMPAPAAPAAPPAWQQAPPAAAAGPAAASPWGAVPPSYPGGTAVPPGAVPLGQYSGAVPGQGVAGVVPPSAVNPQYAAAAPPALTPPQSAPLAPMQQPPTPEPEPVSSFSFPPGLIPQLVRDKSKYSEPYAPMDPTEIENAGLPPPPEKDAYLKSRLNRFMMDIRDYKPGSSRADLEEARASARAQQGLEPDSDEELALGSSGSRLTRRKALGLGAGAEGRRRARLVSGGMADDGSYVGPGGGRGERLGLGAHNPAGSAAALGDVYSSYRRLRSTSYHEMIVGGKGVSNMAKGG